MTLAFLLFGPPVATLILLAALPAGRAYLTGLCLFTIAFAAAAFMVYPLPAQDGSFLEGAELIPLWGAAIAALLAIAFRRQTGTPGTKPQTAIIAVLCAVILAVLAFHFFGG